MSTALPKLQAPIAIIVYNLSGAGYVICKHAKVEGPITATIDAAYWQGKAPPHRGQVLFTPAIIMMHDTDAGHDVGWRASTVFSTAAECQRSIEQSSTPQDSHQDKPQQS